MNPWYSGIGFGYRGFGFGFYGRPYFAPYGSAAPYYASYAPYYTTSYAAAAPVYEQSILAQPAYTDQVVDEQVLVDSAPPVEESQVNSEADNLPAPDETTTPEGLYFQQLAQEAFLAGSYEEAAKHIQHALVEMPRNGKLHLFMSQTLFAIGEYQGAAATIHQGVSLLDPKDWGYVVENYKNFYRGQDFVTQMDKLTAYLKENPKAAYAHFVRGYQHGFLGNTKTAIKELKLAIELEDRDKLAPQLLERFGGKTPDLAEPIEAPAEAPGADS